MTKPSLTETQVADWLREHPDFLARHPDVLSRLELPQEPGVTSLIQRQVDLLRDENRRLQRRLRHLNGVAGENERLMQRLHRMALGLVAAESTEALIRQLDDGLREDFSADAVCLMLEPEQARRLDDPIVAPLPEKRPQWFDEMLEAGKPLCGRLTRDKREAVFGQAGAELGSAALVPLEPAGLLAIGAKSDDRFHPEMGTLFLELLRETLQFRLDRDRNNPARECARA